MANISEIIQQKINRDKGRSESFRMERENLSYMRDRALEEITTRPEHRGRHGPAAEPPAAGAGRTPQSPGAVMKSSVVLSGMVRRQLPPVKAGRFPRPRAVPLGRALTGSRFRRCCQERDYTPKAAILWLLSFWEAGLPVIFWRYAL